MRCIYLGVSAVGVWGWGGGLVWGLRSWDLWGGGMFRVLGGSLGFILGFMMGGGFWREELRLGGGWIPWSGSEVSFGGGSLFLGAVGWGSV